MSIGERAAAFGLVIALSLAAAGGNSTLEAAEKSTGDFAGDVRLTLPKTVYATPGIETNLYFDNVALMLNRRNFAFDATCEKGVQLAERWAFTPAAEDAGSYPLAIEIRDEANALVARATTVVRVVAPGTDRSPKSLLIVGASFVEYSVYPQHILDLSQREGAVPLVLVGSRGAGNMPPVGDLRHEGYSGWTATGFATLAGPLSRSGYHHRPATGSPFVFTTPDGETAVDFARYCDELNGGQAPDFVTIDLGGNDIFSATDETIDVAIDRMFEHMDEVIGSIRKAGPETRIGILASTPPAISQDGFRNYRGAGKQTRWQFRRNIHRLIERKIEQYDNRTSEKIHLVPTYVNLDTEHHFPTFSSPRNARSGDPFVRVNNGTHPSPPGYEQIGDSVYGWIVAESADP